MILLPEKYTARDKVISECYAACARSFSVVTYPETFFDQQENGSWNSAQIVLGELWQIVQPTSVVDIGCGLGQWLKAASDLGASHIFGVDGDYIRRDRLRIDESSFRSCDLEVQSCRVVVPEGRSFDLTISLEVAEHLSKSRAASFIDDLCSLGDLVLFSAAIPGQAGFEHLNTQWPAYWSALFRKHDFYCFDKLRPKVWDNTGVEWWYAQNVLMFARVGTASYAAVHHSGAPTSKPMSLVHPGMHAAVSSWYENRLRELEQA
jgi:SAM-dependent methyltransferase